MLFSRLQVVCSVVAACYVISVAFDIAEVAQSAHHHHLNRWLGLAAGDVACVWLWLNQAHFNRLLVGQWTSDEEERASARGRGGVGGAAKGVYTSTAQTLTP